MKKHIILIITLVGITLTFGINTYKMNMPLISHDFSSMNFQDLDLVVQNVEAFYKETFFKKDHLINLYGLTQKFMNKRLIGNFEFLKAENEMMHMFDGKKNNEKFVNDMDHLKVMVEEKQIPLVYIQIPGRNMGGENSTLIRTEQGWDESIDDTLNQIRNLGINTINFQECTEMYGMEPEDIFFKTDIHMRTETEVYLLEILLDYLNDIGVGCDSELNMSSFAKKEYDFLGNFGLSAGKYFAGLDKFAMYYPTFTTDLVLSNNGLIKSGTYEEVLMNGFENLPTCNERTYFITNYLQYPSPCYQIENTLCKNDNSILVIMDSNGLRTMSLLALFENKITIIDPRFRENVDYITDMLSSQSYDAVIVIQSIALLDSGLFPDYLYSPSAKILSYDKSNNSMKIWVENTSQQTWKASDLIRLGVWENGVDIGIRAEISSQDQVNPGERYCFTLDYIPVEENAYIEVQMLQEGITYFGDRFVIN